MAARVSRDDGFAVMDVSVDIVNDPKIRKLYRHSPDHAGVGFLAYVAVMGESWKAGHRVTIEDAWPAVLPFDPAVVDALVRVKLIDAKGFVSMKAWKSWFTPAESRREAARERWRRANEKRTNPSTIDSAVTADDTASSPRGSSDVTGANHSVPFRSVDSVPVDTKKNSPPPAKLGRRTNGTNPRSLGTNPRSKGTSTRQVRADRKRGPTALASVLQEAARREPVERDDDVEAWTK